MGLVCKGLLSKEIAAALGLSRRTVEAHRFNAIAKLDARNAAHAAAMLTEARLGVALGENNHG